MTTITARYTHDGTPTLVEEVDIDVTPRHEPASTSYPLHLFVKATRLRVYNDERPIGDWAADFDLGHIFFTDDSLFRSEAYHEHLVKINGEIDEIPAVLHENLADALDDLVKFYCINRKREANGDDIFFTRAEMNAGNPS